MENNTKYLFCIIDRKIKFFFIFFPPILYTVAFKVCTQNVVLDIFFYRSFVYGFFFIKTIRIHGIVLIKRLHKQDCNGLL